MKLAQIEAKLIDSMGSDLSVVNAARVSFDKESEWEFEAGDIVDDLLNRAQTNQLKQADARLIAYLAKHKHFSPFNHSFLTFRVKAPIFVARQLVKHKFMPWNEVSRRYVDSEPEFYFPEFWRKKAENVKQGSSDNSPDFNGKYKHLFEGGSMTVNVVQLALLQTEDSLNLYKALLDEEVCPEQARMVLPQNTMTEWIWSGTLGAFADMLRLRLDPHTQYESRVVANLIKPQIEAKFPISLNALLAT